MLNPLIRQMAGVSVAVLALTGCYDQVTYLDQNWNEDNQFRTLSYTTSQGSQLIPYDWYLNLRDAQTLLPLNHPSVTARTGFMADLDPDLATNPDALPIGFVKDSDPKTGDWIGVNCAACHTGQIKVADTLIRIDGAPSMGDYILLIQTVKDALDHTLASTLLLAEFADALGATDLELLKADLQAASEELAGILYRDGSENFAGGYGRVDAATAIRNEIFVHDLGVASNYKEPSAPVSYPALWNTPKFEKVQYPGYAENPFGRNVGQVLGVMGRLDLKNPETFLESSVRRENLFYLEQWIGQLKAPQWPSEYLGDIDSAAAERGKALYTAADTNGHSCVSCHALKDDNGQYPLTPAHENAFGMQFMETPLTPITVLGTDPNVLANFYDPTPLQTAQLAPLMGNRTEVSFPEALITLTAYSVGKLFTTDPELTPFEQAAYSGFRVYADGYSADPLFPGYLTRPLEGVWATAPFLHNGSVPNLYELLLPAAERSQTFHVGNIEFDPVKVGYNTRASARSFEFDATQSGNLNIGHEFSTHLSDDQRYDLIEFLKTL